jgi:hypothetical protein
MEQAELFTTKIVRKLLTKEQNKEKRREYDRKWYASLSEERKEKYKDGKRKWYASLSEEQKEKRREYNRKYSASLSEEQREKYRKGVRKRAASLNLDQRRNRKIGYMYGNAKRRAEDKGLPFNLTKQDIADVWPKDDYCPALRIPLRIRIGNKTLAYTTDNSPNLDRIIPRLGYVKGNIAVVSKLANGIMSSARPSEVIKVGKWFDEKYYEVKDKLNV